MFRWRVRASRAVSISITRPHPGLQCGQSHSAGTWVKKAVQIHAPHRPKSQRPLMARCGRRGAGIKVGCFRPISDEMPTARHQDKPGFARLCHTKSLMSPTCDLAADVKAPVGACDDGETTETWRDLCERCGLRVWRPGEYSIYVALR